MEDFAFIEKLFNRRKTDSPEFPNRPSAEFLINELFDFLFLSFEKKKESAAGFSARYTKIRSDFSALLEGMISDKKKAEGIQRNFFNALPAIYENLLLDADAVLQFDPAAHSLEEVFIAYPGFYAISIYRIAHCLHLEGVKILPRLLSEFAHGKTGIDIHPAAVIGSSFFIDHGTGIVIGETAVIGKEVKIYQGVTLGALTVAKENAHTKRHPTIGDKVIIYSGATILGGSTFIGNNSVIGGNVWLTNSVPAHSIVYQKNQAIVRDNNPLPEGLNFVI